MALEEFHIFLRGLVDSDPEVVASLSHVAALVFHYGSGMHSTGFAGLDAPCAVFRAFAGRKWPHSSSFSAVACSCGDWLGLLVTMHFALCSLACRPCWVEEGVAALVVVSGSGTHFPGFAGLDAPRDMFTMIAGRPSWFRLATWNRSWHRATYHGGKHAFPLGVQLLDKVVVMQRQVLGV